MIEGLTKRLAELEKIAESLNIYISFREFDEKTTSCFGRSFLTSNFILIEYSDQTTLQELTSTFFHELGHFWCLQNKKYYRYHTMVRDMDKLSNEDLEYWLKIYIKAERYVDKKGAEIMAAYYPDEDYIWYYKDQAVVNLIKMFELMPMYVELIRRTNPKLYTEHNLDKIAVTCEELL